MSDLEVEMKKRLSVFVVIIFTICLFTICNRGRVSDSGNAEAEMEGNDSLFLEERYEVIGRFFQAYGQKEYDEMKACLTPELAQAYSRTVQAIPRERLLEIDEEEAHVWDGKYYISVKIEAETNKLSSLWPGPEVKNGLTVAYEYICVENIDGTWLITDVTTG